MVLDHSEPLPDGRTGRRWRGHGDVQRGPSRPGGQTKSACVPAWWSMWGLCVIPLRIAGTAILMTVNDPVLPRDVRKRFVGAWAEIQIGEWSLKPLWAEERDGAYDRR